MTWPCAILFPISFATMPPIAFIGQLHALPNGAAVCFHAMTSSHLQRGSNTEMLYPALNQTCMLKPAPCNYSCSSVSHCEFIVVAGDKQWPSSCTCQVPVVKQLLPQIQVLGHVEHTACAGADIDTNMMQSLPAVSPAQPSGAVAVPEFTADLTQEQLQPIVLQHLQDIRPKSCSALDLSKRMWPQQTAMRSCMKRMVRSFLVLIWYFNKPILCKVIQACSFISGLVQGSVAVRFLSCPR